MKKKHELLPLFKQLIRDSETGKRRKKNGELVKASTLRSYTYTFINLQQFAVATGFELRVCDHRKLNTKERATEKNYWKKFYRNFTNYLYKNGCHDNYVGHNIKQVRTFFSYLKHDRDIDVGAYQNWFYVRKEEVPIIVLTPERLKFLIHDREFESRLTEGEKRIKDAFVFGCATGLRFSDLYSLNNKSLEFTNDQWYVKVRSIKTKTYTSVKLPDFAVDIYKRYKPKGARPPIFRPIALFNFNKNLKSIGEKAGWTEPLTKKREKLGKEVELFKSGTRKMRRFCDQMSSHMMRRTAITTMLIFGMPEHLVRNVSGHTSGSSSFYRYVHYARSYVDTEIDKVHEQLNNY